MSCHCPHQNIKHPKQEHHQMQARMWIKKNSHLLLMRMENEKATLEDSLAASHKVVGVFSQN
jgi:hypothetical protein